MRKILTLCSAVAIWLQVVAVSALAEQLPKYQLEDMTYQGAFRLPHGTFGDARVVNTSGQVAVDEPNRRLFLVGSNNISVAEFRIPRNLSTSDTLSDLPMAELPVQNFRNIIDRAETGNPNEVDRITGLYFDDNSLIVNSAVYYDGSASNTDTTLIVESADALDSSEVKGFLKLEGRNHAAGWVSALPSYYQETFEGDLVFGHSNNIPINGRNSIGPSFFLVDSKDLYTTDSGNIIPTKRVLDFSIDNPLHPDIKNTNLTNDLWTQESKAHFGAVFPGTSTYFTLGSSGGHDSGIGYKITQPNGFQCGGFCAEDHKDYYNYVWLWDMADLIRSYNGEVLPHEIRPYYWGKIEFPFEKSSDGDYTSSFVIGATISQTQKLYIVLDKVDNLQSNYSTLPIVLVYDLFPNRPQPPKDIGIN